MGLKSAAAALGFRDSFTFFITALSFNSDARSRSAADEVHDLQTVPIL
jgi:hypothetical protein